MNTVTICDAASGAEAEILVAPGFNCFRFTPGGDWPNVLWAHPEFAGGEQRPSGSGVPILFPFPGRIRGAQFTYEGRDYALENQDGLGSAIHGFVYDRPWRVTSQSANSVVGEFQASVDDPSLAQRWPGDFLVRAEYTVLPGLLSLVIDVRNPGSSPTPFGLGLHPYFRLPLSAGGVADGCRVAAAIGRRWELRDLAPTGKFTPDPGPPLVEGVRFGDAALDDVYSAEPGRKLAGAAPGCVGLVDDQRAGRQVSLMATHSEGAFSTAVVYTPPHREAVCIEPYTCLPNPFELEASGVASGLKTLAPGAAFRAVMLIACREKCDSAR